MKKAGMLAVFLLVVSIACRAAERLLWGPTTPIGSMATPEPITCSDDTCLDACLVRINRVLGTQSFAPLSEAYAEKEANLNLVLYQVEGDKLSEPNILWVPDDFKTYQEDIAAHQRVWNYATAMLPPKYRKWITEYMIFTDGPQNSLAWVHHAYGDDENWRLGVDILDSQNPLGLTETLIHEFGHLVTLNSEQIPVEDYSYTPYQNAATCPQLSLEDGCSEPDSYINLFYQRFWRNLYDEWLETVYKPAAHTAEDLEKLVEEFYSKHEEEFVREYAATNIKEDVAESFTHFVLNPKPSGNTTLDQKFSFFYDFSELVELRRQIIQGVCSYVQK